MRLKNVEIKIFLDDKNSLYFLKVKLIFTDCENLIQRKYVKF